MNTIIKIHVDDIRWAAVGYIYGQVNALRKAYGREPLWLDDTLMRSAQEKADDLYARNYFAHDTPDGEGPPYAENLALNQKDAREVFRDWRESPGHFQNMIDPRWTRIGIGERHLRWCQHFCD